MKSIEIDLKTLESYQNMKDNRVFKHHSTVYKYEPMSFQTIDAFRQFKNTKYSHHLALPNGYLYHKGQYVGYTMKYYSCLFNIKELLLKHQIRSFYEYFKELLELIHELNKKGICYWDFHHGNVRVSWTGHPFLLDLDGSDINPTSEASHNQCEFLSQFIMNEYVGGAKTTNQYITLLESTNTLSQKSIDYLYGTINLSTENPELPYELLEELTNVELQHEIKKLIKSHK